MSDTRKAYLVFSGEYEQRGVDGVFLDRALAEAYVEMEKARNPNDDSEIKEYPIDPAADVIRNRLKTWGLEMDWDGNVTSASEYGPVLGNYGGMEWNPYGQVWRMIVVADDAELAAKVMNERRLVAIAEGTQRQEELRYPRSR